MLSPAFRSSTRGVTLVETCVVVGIVVVLAALILPFSSSMQRKARTAQCLSNMRQAGAAILAYAADNNGNLPTQKKDGLSIWDENGWVGKIRSYIDNQYTLLLCPESKATKKSASYGYNGFASTASLGARVTPVKLNSLLYPARDILLVDGMTTYKTEGFGSYLVVMVEQPDLWWAYPHPYGKQRYGARTVAFADGHVELAPMNTLKGPQMYWPPETP